MSDAIGLLIFMLVCCVLGWIMMGILLFIQHKENEDRKKQQERYLESIYKFTINDDI